MAGQSTKYTLAQALQWMQVYCAKQERSSSMVRQKLFGTGISAHDVEQIIAELIQQGYLNELRYAKAYVTGKFRQNGWGRLKIKAGLQLQDVADTNIRLAMKEIDQDVYQATLAKHFQKCVKGKTKMSAKSQSQIIRYLLSKGFEMELILKLFKKQPL